MKYQIQQFNKFRAISRLLNNYPQAFENKAELLAMLNLFNTQLDELSQFLSQLLRPVSTIHRPKQAVEQQFNDESKRIMGMGRSLATHLGDNSLLDLVKTYEKRLLKVSAFRKLELSNHFVEEISKHAVVAAQYGLTSEQITAYQNTINSFAEALESKDMGLNNRKVNHLKLRHLISVCNSTLRNKLDPFILFYKAEFPELFSEYTVTRNFKSRKTRKSNTVSQRVEIVGTVSNLLDNSPVANAIINIVGFDLVTESDADGYYLFDDLPATSFNISCHCPGYELPDQVSVNAESGESLVVNFALKPMVIA